MSGVWAILYNLERQGGYGFVERKCLQLFWGTMYERTCAGCTSLTDLSVFTLENCF